VLIVGAGGNGNGKCGFPMMDFYDWLEYSAQGDRCITKEQVDRAIGFLPYGRDLEVLMSEGTLNGASVVIKNPLAYMEGNDPTPLYALDTLGILSLFFLERSKGGEPTNEKGPRHHIAAYSSRFELPKCFGFNIPYFNISKQQPALFEYLRKAL